MKEVIKESVWMAEDGQEFETAEQCSLYEQICADPLSFFKEHYLFFDYRVENEDFRQKPWCSPPNKSSHFSKNFFFKRIDKIQFFCYTIYVIKRATGWPTCS